MISESNWNNCLKPLVSQWQSNIGGGTLSTQVYYFRDVVSEGQYLHVINSEVPHIKAVFSSLLSGGNEVERQITSADIWKIWECSHLLVAIWQICYLGDISAYTIIMWRFADVALVCSKAPFPLRWKHGASWQVTECASYFLVVRRLPNSRVLSSWISQVRSQIVLIIELTREIETLAQRHIDLGGLAAP